MNLPSSVDRPLSAQRSPLLGWVAGSVLLALAYAGIGRLALLLAVPPGYATAIFPSAGIALAGLLIWGYRYGFGVLLGSYALNAWVALAQGATPFHAWGVPLGVALGAALQALIGAALIRRWVGYPAPLLNGRDVWRFLLLGAFVSALVSPSVGVTALWLTGIIDAPRYFHSWWTWWIGDAIGILIAAPLMLVFFGAPDAIWRARKMTVALPLAVSCVVVIGAFGYASQWERQRVQLRFDEQATAMVDAMTLRFEVYTGTLLALERFFAATPVVTRTAFHTFVEKTFRYYPGIQALEWLPYVAGGQRQAFESAIRREGFPHFVITQRNARNQVVPAARRKSYVPVAYVAPFAGNESAFGYDVSSNPTRRAALNRARDTGRPVMTGRITLVQERGRQAGALVFRPVYVNGQPLDTVQQRRRYLRGFVLAVFRMGDLVNNALASFPARNYVLRLTDVTNPNHAVLLVAKGALPKTSGHVPVMAVSRLEVAGRTLQATFYPTPVFFGANPGWEAWAMLAGGMAFTALLGAFLLIMTGRAQEIEHLVRRRTAELRGILGTAMEAIITVDDQGRIESVNPAGERLFDYHADVLRGQSIARIMPDLLAVEGSLPQHIGTRHDTLGRRQGGGGVDVEVGISEVALPGRRLYTCIIYDLTERNKVARMKDEFIATVSHELRTPLTSIYGSLGLVASGMAGELPGAAKKMLEIASMNSERLIQLINDILDIEKLEFDKLSFNVQPLDLAKLLRQSVAQNAHFADQYNVRLRLHDSGEAAITVQVDAGRFLQVMANLISNAVKFSPSGDEVAVFTTRRAETVRISVQDYGVGIPEDFQAHIFGKFAQADSSDTRRVGGTGLGLSIVKAIVEKMGGSVGYDSAPGLGATFHVDLPIVHEDGGA